jgi:arylsulfatase A-like enzyme
MNADSNAASLSRRNFLKGAGVCLLASVRAWGKSSRANVLLLFSDQHHAGAMGCAGHAIVKTPTMDGLAGNGIRFGRAYCQDGICVPSRTSMMTGLYPRTTGCLDNPNNPVEPGRYIMLQKLFKHNGYTTGCFGKRHLPRNEMALGWDSSATTINPRLDPSDENYQDWLKENGLDEKYREATGDAIMDSNLFCRISKLKAEQRDAAYTADKTVAFLKNCKSNETPFFCWATFHGPHQPYTPPQKWADMYKPEDMTLPANVDEPIENLPHELQGWRRNKKRPWNLGIAAENKDLYRTFLAYYYAQVTEVDHYMGVIIEQLNRLGLARNTIIIYASDHGDFTAHHGMTEKCALGHNVYEDTLRVPLIISWPARLAKGIVCESLVELLDLYPTLVDLLNLKTPAKMQNLAGISLKPALTQGKSLSRKYAFSENWSQLTVIGKRYKLGTWIDPGPLPKYRTRDNRQRNPDMLFDLQDDPLETVNQVDNPQLAEVKRELQNAMQQWTVKTPSAGRDKLVQSQLRKSR